MLYLKMYRLFIKSLSTLVLSSVVPENPDILETRTFKIKARFFRYFQE